MNVTGSLIQAFIVCPRQAWLLSRQLTGNQYNDFLAIGRLISEESYKREKKEVQIEGGKIDFIRNEKGELILVEVKKSNKHLEASKMQLLFYLKNLSFQNQNIAGEIRIPREKKVIRVSWNAESRKKIEKIIKEVEHLIIQDKPPIVTYSSKCKTCSYNEICWS